MMIERVGRAAGEEAGKGDGLFLGRVPFLRVGADGVVDEDARKHGGRTNLAAIYSAAKTGFFRKRIPAGNRIRPSPS